MSSPFIWGPAAGQVGFLPAQGSSTAGQSLVSDALGNISLKGVGTSAISASAIDWSILGPTGGVYTKTLSGNITVTFSNQVAGETIVVRLTNTASNFTVTWPTVKWSGGSPPTMSPGAVSDIYTFIYDGTSTFGSAVQNMS